MTEAALLHICQVLFQLKSQWSLTNIVFLIEVVRRCSTQPQHTSASVGFTSKRLVLASRRGDDTQGNWNNDHFLSFRLENKKRTDAITKNLYCESRASGTNSHLQGVRVSTISQDCSTLNCGYIISGTRTHTLYNVKQA